MSEDKKKKKKTNYHYIIYSSYRCIAASIQFNYFFFLHQNPINIKLV